ncbi:hypothetical protein [Psychroserpens sp. S379A]|uniref:hypothetical protein n=1 Tax=Psychroserpens sp. S379A TaxID=3415137 RepID=UPI003C7D5016
MKIKTPLKIGIGIVVIGIGLLMLLGIKIPPEKLKASDLSSIAKIKVNNDNVQNLTEKEIKLWKNLEFKISTENYPGETPDYIIDLIGNDSNFRAMYNESSGIIFFSFIPEIEYGFLNSPTPGGWTKPIYEIQASDELLSLLKVN